MKTIAVETLRAQLNKVFLAWGMRKDYCETCTECMLESDLMGIDSHGIGMLPIYEECRLNGAISINAEPVVIRDKGATTQIDAKHGMGHVNATVGMHIAMTKAREFGVGAVNVRRSNHYGAAGVYSNMARQEGLIGFTVTGTRQLSVVPTFGKEARFSTNPIAFAAPGKEGNGFSLDMATSTVAVGKLRIAERANKSMPEGWVLDEYGNPESDPTKALAPAKRRLTPLGGTRDLGSHKGYGLAMMVEILASILGGSSVAGQNLPSEERGQYFNVGHFFLAIDPDAFGEDDHDFEGYLDILNDYLRNTLPADPSQPVLVPGDPEWKTYSERSENGIPMTKKLIEEVRNVCISANSEFILTE